MLNNVSINGRLVKGITLEQVGESVKTRFTVACNRDYKDKDGKTPCDFLDCVAWNAPAHFLEMYADKGDMLAVSGRLQKDTWKDSEGKFDSRTYVQVNTVNLISKVQELGEEQTKPEPKKKTYTRR